MKYWLAAALLICATVPPVRAAGCIRVETTNPIVTPDGVSRAPGIIEACLRNQMSTSVSVYTIFVNGTKLGNFLTRVEKLDADRDGFVQFRELDSGELMLEAFALRQGASLQGYRMQTRVKGSRTYYPQLVLEESAGSEAIHRVPITGTR